MIYAQRPEATACAEYDLWNKRMGRYVRRGSKGIALIDMTGDNPKIKYVFDVSDTGKTERSRRVNLWEYRQEHAQAVSAMLERRYEVTGENGIQLRQIFRYWVLGMVIGSLVSVFLKDRVHDALRSLGDRKLGVLGVFLASALGIASPLCMYGAIPIAASFSRSGIRDDWLAAFMMNSVLRSGTVFLTTGKNHRHSAPRN